MQKGGGAGIQKLIAIKQTCWTYWFKEWDILPLGFGGDILVECLGVWKKVIQEPAANKLRIQRKIDILAVNRPRGPLFEKDGKHLLRGNKKRMYGLTVGALTAVPWAPSFRGLLSEKRGEAGETGSSSNPCVTNSHGSSGIHWLGQIVGRHWAPRKSMGPKGDSYSLNMYGIHDWFEDLLVVIAKNFWRKKMSSQSWNEKRTKVLHSMLPGRKKSNPYNLDHYLHFQNVEIFHLTWLHQCSQHWRGKAAMCSSCEFETLQNVFSINQINKSFRTKNIKTKRTLIFSESDAWVFCHRLEKGMVERSCLHPSTSSRRGDLKKVTHPGKMALVYHSKRWDSRRNHWSQKKTSFTAHLESGRSDSMARMVSGKGWGSRSTPPDGGSSLMWPPPPDQQ